MTVVHWRYIVGLLFVSCVWGQEQEAASFEAATIKQSSDPGAPRKMDLFHDRLDYRNIPLVSLIATAYGVRDLQVVVNSQFKAARFDIVAKVPPGSSRSGVERMLLMLLRERLKLSAHHETREMPIYALVVVPGKPPKLHEVDSAAATARPVNTSGPAGRRLSGKMSLGSLALYLGGQVDKPVINQTGLKGYYDITLEWAQDAGRTSAATEGLDAIPYAPLPRALESQLGLRLEAKRESSDFIVVDSVEARPIDN